MGGLTYYEAQEQKVLLFSQANFINTAQNNKGQSYNLYGRKHPPLSSYPQILNPKYNHWAQYHRLW